MHVGVHGWVTNSSDPCIQRIILRQDDLPFLKSLCKFSLNYIWLWEEGFSRGNRKPSSTYKMLKFKQGFNSSNYQSAHYEGQIPKQRLSPWFDPTSTVEAFETAWSGQFSARKRGYEKFHQSGEALNNLYKQHTTDHETLEIIKELNNFSNTDHSPLLTSQVITPEKSPQLISTSTTPPKLNIKKKNLKKGMVLSSKKQSGFPFLGLKSGDKIFAEKIPRHFTCFNRWSGGSQGGFQPPPGQTFPVPQSDGL